VAYPRAFTQISFLHSIVGTDERAQTALHVTAIGGDPYDPEDVQNEWLAAGSDVADAYESLWKASDVLTATFGRLDAIKFAAIGTNGLYLTDAEIFELSTPLAGTASGITPQTTVVVSLRTATGFGDANYGRMYLPYTMGDNGSNPIMSQARAQGIANAGATFVGEMNGIAGDLPSAGVVVNLSAKGAGTVKVVTRVGVGRVTDTQRRRREQLDEDTQFTNVT
jgi:hypothetical protein